MSTPGTATRFGQRPLTDDLVIARFEVDGRKLAVERTAEEREYLLAVDGRPHADVIAAMTVGPVGDVIDHTAERRYAKDTEIAEWVRRSGTHPASPSRLTALGLFSNLGFVDRMIRHKVIQLQSLTSCPSVAFTTEWACAHILVIFERSDF